MFTKLSKYPFLIPISIAISILFGILYWFVPLYGDDLWYLSRAKDCLTDPWKAFILTCQETVSHLDYDTGRLSNLLSPLWLCILPRWVFALTNSLIIFYSLKFGYRIVGGNQDSFRKYLFLVLFVIGLPWFDYALSIMFTLNYLWPTLLVLIVVWYFLNLIKGRQFRKRVYILMILVCVFTGWMHEGASVPLATAIFVCLFLDKKYLLQRSFIFPYLGLICGILILVCFPAIWVRSSGGALKLFERPLNEALLSVIAFNCMFYLYCLILIYAIVKKRITANTNKVIAAFFLTFGLFSTAIFILFYGGPRVGWFNQLICGIGILWLAGLFSNKCPAALIILSKILVCVLLILHMSLSIVRQSELKREFDEIVKLIKASTDGTVYYDILKPKIDLTFFKTTIRGLNERMPLKELGDFYCEDVQLRILPYDLRNFSHDSFDANSKGKGIYVYKSQYIITDNVPEEINIIKVNTGDHWIESRYRTVVLYAPVQGDTLVWVIPHIQTMSPNIRIDDARW